MGARGISLAVLCGELTAAWLNDEALPLPAALAKHLSAERFACPSVPLNAKPMTRCV
jgi:tRNA 5-methylaminomethyl-2-thiouridine biosynthesis bifunctional protein